MGKLQLIHFSYIPNSLFPNVHKIVSQQAHAQLPFAFSGRFSATFLWRFFVLFSFPWHEKRGDQKWRSPCEMIGLQKCYLPCPFQAILFSLDDDSVSDALRAAFPAGTQDDVFAF